MEIALPGRLVTFSHQVHTRKRSICWHSIHDFRYDSFVANDRIH